MTSEITPREAVARWICERLFRSKWEEQIAGSLPSDCPPVIYDSFGGWKLQAHRDDVLELADEVLALAACPIEAGSVKIQRYELTPYGTLKEAADGWWTSADAAEAAIAERDERIERERSERNEYRKRSAHFSALYLNEQDRAERLEKALRDIATLNKSRDQLQAIARAALQQEGESDV